MFIKICGLTRYEDVMFCDDIGIDFVGFIFFKKSPRFVSPEKVRKFTVKRAKKVGVFVDHTINEIVDIIDIAKLDFVQLHGDYKEEECMILGKERVILTRWPDRYENIVFFIKELEKLKSIGSYFLMDAGIKGGGHGKEIKNKEFLTSIPEDINWILAGGLCLENIDHLLREINPRAVDINSGVEIKPGIKNKEEILKIYKKIK